MPPFRASGIYDRLLESSDGASEAIGINYSAESLLAELHGRYFEQANQGRVFTVAQTAGVTLVNQGSTSTSFALANPAGSGKNVSLIRFDMVITAIGASRVNGMYGLYVNSNVNGATVTGTALTPAPALLGKSAIAVAEPFTSATLPANPTIYRGLTTKISGNTKAGPATTQPFMAQFWTDFHGSCILTPGTTISIQQIGDDGTEASGLCSVVWEEIGILGFDDVG